MIVLKDFKTVNQVFKVGDEIFDEIENLAHWIAGEFVAGEKIVSDVVKTVVADTANTPVPTV